MLVPWFHYLTVVYIRPSEVVKGYISSSSRSRSISWAVFCTQLNLLAALLYSSCILSMSRAKLTRRFTASIRSLTIGNCGNSLSGIRYNHCFYFHINKNIYTKYKYLDRILPESKISWPMFIKSISVSLWVYLSHSADCDEALMSFGGWSSWQKFVREWVTPTGCISSINVY